MKRFFFAAVCLMMVFTCACQSIPLIVIAESTPSPVPTAEPAITPAISETPEPAPTPEPEPIRVSVLAAGDLLCLNAQLSAAKKGGDYQFDYCFNEIKEKVSSADLAIANLETLVALSFDYTGPAPTAIPTPDTSVDTGGEGTALSTIPVTPIKAGNTKINAPESYLGAVVNCGFDVLTNANNHIYDWKDEGTIQTVQKLDEYGVYHTGAYAVEQEKAPLIIDVKGINISVLAYTDILNNRPGSSNVFMVDTYSKDLVKADINAAASSGADYIIVCMHWGTEHTHQPTSSQKKMAEFIAKSGADIIIGSHPHCTQPIDIIETDNGSVPVVYSLGNFVSSMAKTMHNDGVMLNLVLEKNQITGETTLAALTYTPTLCTSTGAGRFVVLPADLESIAQSRNASELNASRKRTIEVLSDTIAIPE
ncbi:MAG: CapA family protein [Christensenellales bacterium]|jgi:poly-gamma-glutamate capsule biosynthesis protein CapA/YwtB (metallophosphatase superfamily)